MFLTYYCPQAASGDGLLQCQPLLEELLVSFPDGSLSQLGLHPGIKELIARHPGIELGGQKVDDYADEAPTWV